MLSADRAPIRHQAARYCANKPAGSEVLRKYASRHRGTAVLSRAALHLGQDRIDHVILPGDEEPGPARGWDEGRAMRGMPGNGRACRDQRDVGQGQTTAADHRVSDTQQQQKKKWQERGAHGAPGPAHARQPSVHGSPACTAACRSSQPHEKMMSTSSDVSCISWEVWLKKSSSWAAARSAAAGGGGGGGNHGRAWLGSGVAAGIAPSRPPQETSRHRGSQPSSHVHPTDAIKLTEPQEQPPNPKTQQASHPKRERPATQN